MNLEPRRPSSEIRNHSGVARVLATLTILALAAITILVVLEVIPRSAFTEMAGKTAMIAGSLRGVRARHRAPLPALMPA